MHVETENKARPCEKRSQGCIPGSGCPWERFLHLLWRHPITSRPDPPERTSEASQIEPFFNAVNQDEESVAMAVPFLTAEAPGHTPSLARPHSGVPPPGDHAPSVLVGTAPALAGVRGQRRRVNAVRNLLARPLTGRRTRVAEADVVFALLHQLLAHNDRLRNGAKVRVVPVAHVLALAAGVDAAKVDAAVEEVVALGAPPRAAARLVNVFGRHAGGKVEEDGNSNGRGSSGATERRHVERRWWVGGPWPRLGGENGKRGGEATAGWRGGEPKKASQADDEVVWRRSAARQAGAASHGFYRPSAVGGRLPSTQAAWTPPPSPPSLLSVRLLGRSPARGLASRSLARKVWVRPLSVSALSSGLHSPSTARRTFEFLPWRLGYMAGARQVDPHLLCPSEWVATEMSLGAGSSLARGVTSWGPRFGGRNTRKGTSPWMCSTMDIHGISAAPALGARHCLPPPLGEGEPGRRDSPATPLCGSARLHMGRWEQPAPLPTLTSRAVSGWPESRRGPPRWMVPVEFATLLWPVRAATRSCAYNWPGHTPWAAHRRCPRGQGKAVGAEPLARVKREVCIRHRGAGGRRRTAQSAADPADSHRSFPSNWFGWSHSFSFSAVRSVQNSSFVPEKKSGRKKKINRQT